VSTARSVRFAAVHGESGFEFGWETRVFERERGAEAAMLSALRSGDEAAFAALVDDLHGRLLAFAGTFTSSPAVAEDIVQETWLGVIRGLRGFEGRSSLRTWIFNILVRRARTLAAREARRAGVEVRSVERTPESSSEEWEPGQGRRGLWRENPVSWGLEDPAAIFQTREALEQVRDALATLPERQRQVEFLRDEEDLGSPDVWNVLQISETNQRVLLHRGRARIRSMLDRYLREGGSIRPRARAAGGTGTTAAPGMGSAPARGRSE
jgi:RNA polymerase sigma-70 factor (ECF subfamily)